MLLQKSLLKVSSSTEVWRSTGICEGAGDVQRCTVHDSLSVCRTKRLTCKYASLETSYMLYIFAKQMHFSS